MNFRTYVHATEDEDKVLQAIAFLLGDVEVKQVRSTGFYGNPITILEGKLDKDKQIKSFWEKLEDARPGIIKSIIRTLDSRIDNEGTFFVRFDKQKAYLGEYKLAEGQDVIETRWRVAVYPSKKEVTSRELKLFFEELTKRKKGNEEE